MARRTFAIAAVVASTLGAGLIGPGPQTADARPGAVEPARSAAAVASTPRPSGLQVPTHETANDSADIKTMAVTCPEGKLVTGGAPRSGTVASRWS
jgi:hypothetical protein